MHRAALVLLGLLLFALPAAAQSPNNQISYAAMMKAPIGSWSEYLMQKEHEQAVRVRYTLVQRDKKRIALEVDSSTPQGRMLVRLEFGVDGVARYKLEKARMKLGETTSEDMPLPNEMHFGKDETFGDPVGREEVVVKAGKFFADHFRRKDQARTTEVWMDDKIFPVGMVKLADDAESSIQLVAQGKGGKTAF